MTENNIVLEYLSQCKAAISDHHSKNPKSSLSETTIQVEDKTLKSYTAEYLHPIAGLINIEFDHDFDSDNQHFSGRNISSGHTFHFLYVGYLIYSSIQELQLAGVLHG